MIAEFTAHIESLCAANNITIEWGGTGRAWKKSRKIRTPEIKSEITYAIALHEIGHILGKMQDGYRLEKEVGAWLWAKDNAIIWNKPMIKTLKHRLTSYLKWCKRRRGVWVPPANHIAWSLAA